MCMRKITRTIRPVLWAIVFVVLSSIGLTQTVSAYSIQEGIYAAKGSDQPTDLFGAGGVITTVVNILLFVVGALAVIMIIVGGLRYVVSGGNATSVTAAKNTILYAIVGLIIAFLAFAAVNWVFGTLSPDGTAGFTNV